MPSAGRGIEISLVLQGGGALGAYEWGALQALLGLMEEAARCGRPVGFKAVTGVSIGAINAACVVGAAGLADARRRLDALWDDLTLHAPDFWPRESQRDLSLLGLPGFYIPRIDYLSFPSWTSYYDTSPLLATLDRHVDFEALNASPTVFVVSAVDVESGLLTRFSNRRADGEPPLSAKHILASGSLPPQFPWTEIGGRRYWDGGIVDNTPLADAIDAFSHGDGIERILVTVDLYPLEGRLPRIMADVEDRVHELSFGNRLRQDRRFADRINELYDLIGELAPLVPADSMAAALGARVARALDYKKIRFINIDMQFPPPHGVAGQNPADNKDGLRDFSLETVRQRRVEGFARGQDSLRPFFVECGFIPAEPSTAAASGS